MSTYKISDASEIDNKLVELLKTYWFEDLKWDKQYSRYGNLAITKTHPFATILSDLDRNTPQSVLPAISVALVDDGSSDIVINRGIDKIEMTESLINELRDQSRSDYSLNRDTILKSLLKLVQTGQKVFADQINRRYTQRITMEIWTENDVVKSLLYEGLKDFLDFYLKSLYDLGVENLSITGKKDGDYNFDFGQVLYGSIVNMNYTVTNMLFEVDSDILEIAGIKHAVENIDATTNAQ